MKKTILFLLLVTLVCGNVYSQAKKAPVKRTPVKKTVVIEKKTDEQLAIEKAQLWFKDKYVETMFKDPYSYRVVGIKAVSITNGDWLDKQASKVEKMMSKFNVSPSENPEKQLVEVKDLIKECDEELDKNHSIASRNRFKEIKNDCLKLAKELELYLECKDQLKDIIKTKNEMSEEELHKFAFYDIHLDCYSKNEIGNEVLGRFVFPFTKDGVFVDDNTTYNMVEKIN